MEEQIVLEENKERCLNVPNKYIQHNNVTELFDKHYNVEKRFLEYMKDVNSVDISTLNSDWNIHKEIRETLSNQFIRVYGKCLDMWNRHNSYTEYVGKIKYKKDDSVWNTFTDYSTNWKFTGITIARNADNDQMLWIDVAHGIKIHMFETFQISNNTMSIITREEYNSVIDKYMKNI